MKVSQLLNQNKVVPVVVIENQVQAMGLTEALLAGGVTVIEVTLRNDFGVRAIELIKKQTPDVTVLAGTVNTTEAMQQVVDAGVDGVITPGVTSQLIESAQRNKVPMLPGVASPSEVLLAMQYGLNECKLFPASIVGGIDMLKALAGPFPMMRFCPTGGVSVNNYKDYLALDNVMCVGGSWIAPKSLIAQQNWYEITRLCKAIV